MADFPGYDVLAKRHTLSWNETTRRVVDSRLAIGREPRFFSQVQWKTLQKLCDRILPQPADRAPVPIAAYIDDKMLTFGEHGTRIAPMPYDGEAWRRGLDAIEAEARAAHAASFHDLGDSDAEMLLHRMQAGELHDASWGEMAAHDFFAKRILQDIPAAYYSHPTAWSEIGFGGPASPRGYVRMEANRRDPWEAVEAKPGAEADALKNNKNVR